MSATRKIVVLGTGGTIAGVGNAQDAGVGYQAGQIAVAQLLQPVLQSGALGDVGFEMEQVAQLDSKDMDAATWQQLAAACQQWLGREDVSAVVITHGTDTLEETAWFLQSVLQPAKPVVMTCAMRPATALSADGPANLRDAAVAASQATPGVWVVAAGAMHSAKWVRKVHPYRVDAFSSDAHGALAWVEERRLRWAYQPLQPATRPGKPLLQAVLSVPPSKWPWVEIVYSTAAARAAAVDALAAAGVEGLVVATTGNGSIHKDMLPALQRAGGLGIPIWRVTRCEQGQIVLADHAVDAAVSELSACKARISLMLKLLERAHQ